MNYFSLSTQHKYVYRYTKNMNIFLYNILGKFDDIGRFRQSFGRLQIEGKVEEEEETELKTCSKNMLKIFL